MLCVRRIFGFARLAASFVPAAGAGRVRLPLEVLPAVLVTLVFMLSPSTFCNKNAYRHQRKRASFKRGSIYTRHCSNPRTKTSFGSDLPMKTILLPRGSFSGHFAPISVPMVW